MAITWFLVSSNQASLPPFFLFISFFFIPEAVMLKFSSSYTGVFNWRERPREGWEEESKEAVKNWRGGKLCSRGRLSYIRGRGGGVCVCVCVCGEVCCEHTLSHTGHIHPQQQQQHLHRRNETGKRMNTGLHPSSHLACPPSPPSP